MKPLMLSLMQVMSMLAAGSAIAQVAPETMPAPPTTTVATVPGDFDQQFKAARDLATSGKRAEAIRAYSVLLDRSPENADVLVGRGRVHAWDGRWTQAETDLRAAVSVAPTYADGWSALGDMYLWSDRPVQAAEAYGRWAALRPGDPAPRIARGRALRAAGDLASARGEFEAAGTLGADAGEIQDHLLSLQQRVQNPEAVVPEGYLWSARLSADRTSFSPARDRWSDYGLSLRRHFDRGSLAVEWLGAHRFGDSDRAWALDGYVDLWPKAYANLRYQHGPQAALFPERAWRAEIFQGVGPGWELSASYDRLAFTRSDVEFYSVGVGKYVGNFYLRARTLYVPGNGTHSVGYRGLVRYYYAGDADNYVELTGGSGSGTDILRDGAVSRRHSTSAGIAWVKYPTPRWGFKLGFDYGDEDQGFTAHNVSGALYRRW